VANPGAGIKIVQLVVKTVAMKSGIVPKQVEGGESNNSHQVECGNRADAMILYLTARKRLLNVNSWQKICNGLLKANFALCDAKGNPVSRLADEKDYIKIDIPGPGPAAGNGFDWVRVEKILIRKDENRDIDMISMRVRPSAPPKKEDKSVAHFFSPEATSTFIVQRDGTKVSAEIHGRNEQANTDVEKNRDKIRNEMVTAAATAGFADMQWKELVIGLLSL